MSAPDPPTYRTGIGTSTADAITLLGHDLARDLMGRISFGELAFWLVAKRRPSAGELTVFEAVLVSLADHGFTPTAIAARVTYTSAPESLQGALAAGLLGGGSRFLGVTEDAAMFLSAALAERSARPDDAAGWDQFAVDGRGPGEGGRAASSPGWGTPCTRSRTLVRRCSSSSPAARARSTTTSQLFAAIGRVHPQILGRTLPLNGAGAVRCRRWPTSASRCTRCGASPSSPGAPGSSAISPRSTATPSGWTST